MPPIMGVPGVPTLPELDPEVGLFGVAKYVAELFSCRFHVGLVWNPATGFPKGKLDAAEYASCITDNPSVR